jgi:hypothetical protein
MKIWAKTTKFFEGKFLVVRRDGTVPHWPHFVLGARDPAATAGLLAYAEKARDLGFDPAYCDSVVELATKDFPAYLEKEGAGDPESPPHRIDHPDVIALMRGYQKTVCLRPDVKNTPKPPACPTCKTPLRGE